MAITFQKRQKELKRQEKQREKAERRAQRKLAKRAETEAVPDNGVVAENNAQPTEPDSQQ
jgi:hypothetical protein